MATRTHYFSQNIHLFPLYMKLAADSFTYGRTHDGMAFFNYAAKFPETFAKKVYEQMWKIKNPQEGDHCYGDHNYGEKSFHGVGRLLSSDQEKAQAIYLSLLGSDSEEMQKQEDKIHETLWRMHKEPLGDNKYGQNAFNNSNGRYASLESKLQAIFKYGTESTLLTWFSEDKEIRLLRSGKGLKFLAIDSASGRIWDGPLQFGDIPVEDYIPQLAELDVTLNGDEPVFSKMVQHENWPNNFSFGTRAVKILKRGDHLIWHAFESSYPFKTSSWLLADNDTRHALNYLGTIPRSEREACVRKDFNFEIKFDELTRRLLSVSIKCTNVILPKLNLKEVKVPIQERFAGFTHEGKIAFDHYSAHVYPLYLYLAAKSFDYGEASQGMALFKLACGNPRVFENEVYGQMQKIKSPNEQQDFEYGRKSFHGADGLFSSDQEKAQAIYASLKDADWEEIHLLENKFCENLGRTSGEPPRPWNIEHGKQIFYNLYKHSSKSLEDKISSIHQVTCQTRLWTHYSEDKEIRFIRKGDGLKCLALDNACGSVLSSSVNCGDLSVENQISNFAKMLLTFENGSPHFSELIRCEEWPINVHNHGQWSHRIVNLLWKGDDWIWHVVDLTEKTSSWILAGQDTKDTMQLISTSTPAIREEFIAKCCDIEMEFQCGSGRLLKASIKPRIIKAVDTQQISNRITHASSQFDPSKIIDENNWAITLISTGQSSGSWIPLADLEIGDPLKFGHAEIIYEGLERGAKFTKMVHIFATGVFSAKVEHKPINRKVLYSQKSPTWERPRALVERMINRINEDTGRTILFNQIGNDLLSKNTWKLAYDSFIEGTRVGRKTLSIGEKISMGKEYIERIKSDPTSSFDYNCLTYAIEGIELTGIKLPPISAPLAVPSNYVGWLAQNPSLAKLSSI